MAPDLRTTPADTPDAGTRLGTNFWAGWAAAMVGTLAAFGVTLWFAIPHLESTEGKIAAGGLAIVFTAVLAFVANIPNTKRRKRGFGEPMREPYRRYMARFMPAMFGYVMLLMAAISYADQTQPEGVLAWGIAIAPAIPLIFAIRAVFLLPREENDEYQRARVYLAYAWATGATLMVCTAAGFLDTFGVIPHLELWVVFPMWAVFMGIARYLPLKVQ